MPAVLIPAKGVRNDSEITAVIPDFKTIARKVKDEVQSKAIGDIAKNIRFDEELTSITKRKRRALYGGMTTLGTSPVRFGYRYYKNSNNTQVLIIAHSTTLKKGSETTGVFTNIKTGLTADKRWSALTMKDLWYATNNTEVPFTYDGTTVENMGVPVPTAPTSPASGGAGSLTGVYLWKLTYFIDGYQEGNASSASASFTATANSVDLTIPVSTNTRVTKRWLYRTKAGGTVYYFVKEIANNTATTVNDNVGDTSLDLTLIAPTDNSGPGVQQFMTSHKARIFMMTGSKVIYSKIKDGISYPDVFPSDNFFYSLRDNGEDGAVLMQDTFGNLILMKPSAVIRINTGADEPAAWSGFDDILSVHGCAAPQSAAKTLLGILYLTRFAGGKKRLMLWNGVRADPVFEELEPILSTIIDSDLAENVIGHYHGGIYYLAYKTGDNTYNDQLLQIDFINKTVTIDDKNVDCFSSWNGTDDRNELFTGTSDATGFVYREDTDEGDVLINLKSELDLGTYEQCQSAGTEAAPTLVLIQSQLTDDYGPKLASQTDVVSALTNDLTQTVAPGGRYTSKIFEIKSAALKNIYWNEVLGTKGEVLLRIRAHDTKTGILTAPWSADYTTPGGSDISAITSKRYIQVQAQLYATDTDAAVSLASEVYLQRGTTPNDYVIKVSTASGTLETSAIDFTYETGFLDFSFIDERLARVRKKMRQVKIDFVRAVATGTLVYGYQLDGADASTRVDTNYLLSTYASKGFIIHQFPLATYFRTIKSRIRQNDDVEDLKITRMTFIFTVEPMYPLI